MRARSGCVGSSSIGWTWPIEADVSVEVATDEGEVEEVDIEDRED